MQFSALRAGLARYRAPHSLHPHQPIRQRPGVSMTSDPTSSRSQSAPAEAQADRNQYHDPVHLDRPAARCSRARLSLIPAASRRSQITKTPANRGKLGQSTFSAVEAGTRSSVPPVWSTDHPDLQEERIRCIARCGTTRLSTLQARLRIAVLNICSTHGSQYHSNLDPGPDPPRPRRRGLRSRSRPHPAGQLRWIQPRRGDSIESRHDRGNAALQH
jgi:hypothetical protein